MFDWKPTWWQVIILYVLIIISTVICFPCWLLQLVGVKCKVYARFLCKVGFEQLSFLPIIEPYE